MIVTCALSVTVFYLLYRLPKIREEVQRNLDRCQDELDKLPSAPKDDASTEILKMVNSFCKELGDTIYGTGDNKTMVQGNRVSYDRFGKSILGTAPNFQPFESSLSAEVSDNEAEDRNMSDVEGTSSTQPIYLQEVRETIKRYLLPSLRNVTVGIS